MMLRIACLLSIGSLYITNPAQGQHKEQVEYFTEEWQPQLTSYNAKYYRTIEKQEGGYLVKDFVMANDHLYRTMECASVKPDLVREGKTVWYFENGNVESEGLYAKDFRTGLWKTYYENGDPKEELIYRGEETLFAQCWSPNGNVLLDHGTGTMKESKDDSGTTMYTTFRDSLVVVAYMVRHNQADTIYHVLEKMAAYKHGIEGLYKEVGRSLAGKYPANARRMGIEGKVYIQFIVDKAGKVRESKVLRGIGGGCDELALQSITALSAWEPAIHNGRAVKQMFVLPVVFRLN